MRRILTLGLGILLGQGLGFGSTTAPGDQAVGSARAWRGADDPDLERRTVDVARLTPATRSRARDTTVPLEPTLGVWLTRVVLNGAHAGRFLVDTGSSVTVVSPRLAGQVGISQTAGRTPVELQTLGGRTSGLSAIVRSLRVGDLEVSDAPVVIHDPGSGVDGILGNSVLGRCRVIVDADRRQLHLRLLARD